MLLQVLRLHHCLPVASLHPSTIYPPLISCPINALHMKQQNIYISEHLHAVF